MFKHLTVNKHRTFLIHLGNEQFDEHVNNLFMRGNNTQSNIVTFLIMKNVESPKSVYQIN